MQFFTYIGMALSDKGEPSSKRIIGFVIIIFTMLVYSLKGMEYEFFITWLSSGLIALGISGIEKFAKPNGKQP